MIQISSPRNEQISLKTISEKSKKSKLNYPFQPNDNSSGFEINSLSFDQSELESQKPSRNTLKQLKIQQSQINCHSINTTRKNCYNSDIVQQVKESVVQEVSKQLDSTFFQENGNVTSEILQQLLNKKLSDVQFAKQRNIRKKIQLDENSLYKLTQVLILLLIGIMSPTWLVLENTPFTTYGCLFQITLLISFILLHLFLKSKSIVSTKVKTKDVLMYLVQNLCYELFILLLSIILFLSDLLQISQLDVLNIIQTIACIICLAKNISLSNQSRQAGLKILLGNLIFFHLLECYKLRITNLQSLNLQTFCRKYILTIVQLNSFQESEDNVSLALLEIAQIIFKYLLISQVFIYLLNLWNTYFSLEFLLANKYKQYERLMRDLDVDQQTSKTILKQTKSYELEEIKYLQLFDHLISNQHFILQLKRLLFQQSQLFEQFSDKTQEQLIQMMELHLINPQQIISSDSLNEEESINFLVHGTLDVGIKNKQNYNFEKIQELEQGLHFGQLTFFTGQRDCLSYRSNHYTLLFKLKRQNMLTHLETNLADKEILSIIINSVINKQNYSLLKLYCQCCNSSDHTLTSCPQLHISIDKKDLISQFLSPKNQDRIKCIIFIYLDTRQQIKKRNNMIKFRWPKSNFSSDISKNLQRKEKNPQIVEWKSSAFNIEINSDIPKEFTSEKILEQQMVSHQLNSINSERLIQEFQNDTHKKSKGLTNLDQNFEHNQVNVGSLNFDGQDNYICPYQFVISESKPQLEDFDSSNMINNLNSYKSKQMSATNQNSLQHHQFISLTGQVTSVLNNEFYNQFTNLNIDKWWNYEYFDVEYNLQSIVQKITQGKGDQNVVKQTQNYNLIIRIDENMMIQED
ncbi:unnamed protein product (macronuclear) [Paramecium tetraurelia]|uniref:Cyclic nucleotide-binding domain-containing protein n=1 Tax=Paramecium tetraurelia TaxID=5888 RepID=A0BGX7_PARTE|nr:uncharacterized protein GSPATT00028829001 [Paramecium tetraurelia]CAK57794.1 unnamed protein product [Paramecium tetraurelia]|eukprot:XP_001425192.1 hypothetical protein (macronuclear) [Paramecium tetraurelia strain d4-2]